VVLFGAGFALSSTRLSFLAAALVSWAREFGSSSSLCARVPQLRSNCITSSRRGRREEGIAAPSPSALPTHGHGDTRKAARALRTRRSALFSSLRILLALPPSRSRSPSYSRAVPLGRVCVSRVFGRSLAPWKNGRANHSGVISIGSALRERKSVAWR
jgi:hypothetical protein